MVAESVNDPYLPAFAALRLAPFVPPHLQPNAATFHRYFSDFQQRGNGFRGVMTLPAEKRSTYLSIVNQLVDQFRADRRWRTEIVNVPEVAGLGAVLRIARGQHGWDPWRPSGSGLTRALMLARGFFTSWEMEAGDAEDLVTIATGLFGSALAQPRRRGIAPMLAELSDDLVAKYRLGQGFWMPMIRTVVEAVASDVLGHEFRFAPFRLNDPEADVFFSDLECVHLEFPLARAETRASIIRRIDLVREHLLMMLAPAVTVGRPMETERGVRWLYENRVRRVSQTSLASAAGLQQPHVHREIKKIQSLLDQAQRSKG